MRQGSLCCSVRTGICAAVLFRQVRKFIWECRRLLFIHCMCLFLPGDMYTDDHDNNRSDEKCDIYFGDELMSEWRQLFSE